MRVKSDHRSRGVQRDHPVEALIFFRLFLSNCLNWNSPTAMITPHSRVLSGHCFCFLLIFFSSLLGYQKDCNVAAHSVDSDIFYVVISLTAGSKSYIITFISQSSVKL